MSTNRSRVAIVGVGAVGRAMASLFTEAVLYDEPREIGERDAVNRCDLAFVAVPTPADEGGSCDTSMVEAVISWLETPLIVLRSTVSPGTTRRLARTHGKRLVFQPEYGPGTTPDHPFADPRSVGWIILGGEPADTRAVARAWKAVRSSELVIRHTTPEAAELAKYMENAFLATKVMFCNEMHDIAERTGVDYDELRELWLLDPRVGRSHTWVHTDDPGFGGDCLPKDLDALIRTAERAGANPTVLREVAAANRRLREARAGDRAARRS